MRTGVAEIERRREHVREVVEHGLHGRIVGYFRRRRVVIAEIPAVISANALRAAGYGCVLIGHANSTMPACERLLPSGSRYVPAGDDLQRVAVYEVDLGR